MKDVPLYTSAEMTSVIKGTWNKCADAVAREIQDLRERGYDERTLEIIGDFVKELHY